MKLEEEQIAFYMQLGFALSQWALVEDSIRAIVAGGFPTSPHKEAINVGFVSLDAFRAKMDFAKPVVERILYNKKPKFLEEWKKLAKRSMNASERRNNLAHWRVSHYPNAAPGYRYALERWKMKKGARKSNDAPMDGALGVLEVAAYRKEFSALVAELRNFLCRLAGEPEEYSPHKPTPPTIEEVLQQARVGVRSNPLAGANSQQ